MPTGYKTNYRVLAQYQLNGLLSNLSENSLSSCLYGRTEEKVYNGIQSLAYLRANNEPKTSEEHFLILAQL